MTIKLFDSELKVMEILWERGDTTAKQIAATLLKRAGAKHHLYGYQVY